MSVALQCPVCKQTFRDTPAHARERIYCSRPCMAIGYATRLTGANNPNYRNAGQYTCLACGKAFQSYNKRKYCSPECFTAFNLDSIRAWALYAAKCPRRRPRKPRPRKPVPERKCVVCGGALPRGAQKACSHKCLRTYRNSYARAYVLKAPPRQCLQCGTAFHSWNRTQHYCSYACALASGSSFRAGLASRKAVMKYGPKKDANHHLIIDVLRGNGVAIFDTSTLGRGMPDCVAWVRNAWHLVEIKNPESGYGRRGLNAIQKKWIAQWQGGPIYILRTIEEAEQFAKGNLDNIECVDSAACLKMKGQNP